MIDNVPFYSTIGLKFAHMYSAFININTTYGYSMYSNVNFMSYTVVRKFFNAKTLQLLYLIRNVTVNYVYFALKLLKVVTLSCVQYVQTIHIVVCATRPAPIFRLTELTKALC